MNHLGLRIKRNEVIAPGQHKQLVRSNYHHMKLWAIRIKLTTKQQITGSQGLTFDKPPENNANEKSARWLINWNFKVAFPVVVYPALESLANLYWKWKQLLWNSFNKLNSNGS